MKLNSLKSTLVVLLTVSVISTSVMAAVSDDPWLVDWSGETGYTSQFWQLAAVEDAEPATPLAPDVYSNNSYGTAAASWTNSPAGQQGSLVSWSDIPAMATHPSWARGTYGGMVSMSGYWDIGATVNTGTESGTLLAVVQYDWYKYTSAAPGHTADISASISGATDITPVGYYDYQIGVSSTGSPWMRTTQVFELAANPGSIDVVFSASGFVTMLDSFSVTTAVGDASSLVPAQMPIPEPATVAILGLGALVARRRWKK